MEKKGSRAAHLQVLGLSSDAGWDAIQGRYRELVLALHPDLRPRDPGAAESFRRVAASYGVLAALRRQSLENSPENLRRLCQDSRLRALGLVELGLRLRHSTSPWVRAAAACLLGGEGRNADESRVLLKAAYLDPEARVRGAAVESLGRVGRPGDLAGYLFCKAARRDLPAGIFFRTAGAIWARTIHSMAAGLTRAIGVWR